MDNSRTHFTHSQLPPNLSGSPPVPPTYYTQQAPSHHSSPHLSYTTHSRSSNSFEAQALQAHLANQSVGSRYSEFSAISRQGTPVHAAGVAPAGSTPCASFHGSTPNSSSGQRSVSGSRLASQAVYLRSNPGPIPHQVCIRTSPTFNHAQSHVTQISDDSRSFSNSTRNINRLTAQPAPPLASPIPRSFPPEVPRSAGNSHCSDNGRSFSQSTPNSNNSGSQPRPQLAYSVSHSVSLDVPRSTVNPHHQHPTPASLPPLQLFPCISAAEAQPTQSSLPSRKRLPPQKNVQRSAAPSHPQAPVKVAASKPPSVTFSDLPAPSENFKTASTNFSTAPPLIDLHKRINYKRKRAPSVDTTAQEPRSMEELLQMTEADLAAEAHRSSKGAMSNADRSFFLDFYHQQRKELVIKAIEHGVSMPMVDSFLGKRMVIKKLTSWNRFMKTHQARKVFSGPRKGVKQKTAMGGVSKLYHSLSVEEKKAYQVPAPPETSDGEDTAESALASQPPDVDESLSTAHERGMRQTVSFKRASDQVQNFMDSWVQQAVHVAKTCSCEMVFFTVSKHLGPHSFQFMQTTHGASAFAGAAQNVDGARNYLARMQSFFVGYQVSEIAAIADGKPGKNKSRAVTAVARMSQLIAEKTNGALTQWPWTNTDAELAEFKYRLVLLPGAKTQREWITTPSRNFNVRCQAFTHKDLDENLIDVVHDPSIPDTIKPVKPPGPKKPRAPRKRIPKDTDKATAKTPRKRAPKALGKRKAKVISSDSEESSPPASAAPSPSMSFRESDSSSSELNDIGLGLGDDADDTDEVPDE
ncbi:hypothetical protein MJO28_003785 [Puccinia striiformis f. sp. tritici]|uniref:Uncharacterized protein n=2 Tax=Puccinia striiformis TaxID=27350 RepID=A0A2S4VN32_9BASI|nr:hypothetical protein MJO28_003785 [Puccinia striiformis f. sp. tritici]POW10790.1 hypothetical protein PSTT_05740 [Puccinia striiformis]